MLEELIAGVLSCGSKIQTRSLFVVLALKQGREYVREARMIKRGKMVHKVDRGEVETYRETMMLSSDCGSAVASVFEQPGGGGLGFWRGTSAGGGRVYMDVETWVRGKKSYQNRREFGSDSLGLVVLVPSSSNGMTSGSLLSAAKRLGSSYRFGKRSRRVVGRNLAWTGVLPHGLFNFFLFFFFFSLLFLL
jgi:hypothetical protein